MALKTKTLLFISTSNCDLLHYYGKSWKNSRTKHTKNSTYLHSLFAGFFKLQISFSGHIQGWEEISYQTHEHRHVVCNDLRYIEVAKRSH